MATNALAPTSKNALSRGTDPLQTLLKQAAETPQYRDLVEYLSSRRMMPPISLDKPFGGGVFERDSFFSDSLPKTGVVKIGYGAGPSTLVHELTHAADNQIHQQYFQLKNKRGELTPAEQQFMQAYEKLSYNSTRRNPDESLVRESLARKLDPEWAKKNRAYRASNTELPAWGMGFAVEPRRDYDQPLHLDPTMATEFSILLDMANRLQKSQPITDKR